MTDSEGKEKTVADLSPDGAAITTQYQYDENGQKVKETYQDGSYVEYSYDAAGKVKEQTAFQSDGTRTLVTRYEYDDTTDQLLAMKDYKVTGGEEEPLRYTGYAYDDFGRIAAYTEVDGDDAPSSYKKGKATVEYKYNGEDELTEVLYPNTGDSLKGLLFCYDENGWLTEIKAKMTGTLTDGTVRAYTYDTDGKVKEIRDYTSFDHLVNISPDYILRRYTYDDLDRVTSMKYMDGKNQDRILEEYAYTYDKNDNILTERIINHTPSGEEEKTDELRSHSYDEKGQLTKTVLNDYRNQKTTTIQYEYDKAGNRTKYSVKSGEEETETTYAYNGLHQLTASMEKRNGNTTSSITYTYDAKGNETKEADSVVGTETIYAYDVLNQLSKVTRKAGEQVELTQENWYNGEGKRIQKSEKGTTTRYFYDNGQVLYTLNKEDEKTTQNLSGISDNVIATKRYEGDDEGRLYFYNKDVKGSTSSILDDNLNGIVSYDYDDYGVTEKRGDAGFLNEICYTGGIYDDSTSLYYLNARYYDPSTGRFLSEDTYRGEPADANTWHLYAYCANNPVNYVDPSGHKYSPSKAANYAYKWGNRRNSQYRSHIKDCTNFVSQCVYAGGKTMKKPKKKIPNGMKNTIYYWYSIKYVIPPANYRWKESSSWIGVSDFYNYWKNNGAQIIQCKTIKILNNKAKLGDIVQLNEGKGWYHSIIISKGRKGNWKYAGHSNNRKANSVKNIGCRNKFRIIRIR